MWLYLQIIGKPTEKFQNETNFWTFNRTDFKSAITCLWLNDKEEMDETAIKMEELISKHFLSKMDLVDWLETFFDQVKRLSRNATRVKLRKVTLIFSMRPIGGIHFTFR